MPADGVARWLETVWYHGGRGLWLLWPLELFFRAVTSLRRLGYRTGVLRSRHVDAPVVIVGNLVAGGSGKTPLVGWLARTLQARGEHPAIVSRGYGGRAGTTPLTVTTTSDAADVGDEPLMLARQTGVPVVVCRDRHAAARAAVAAGARLIIADDGLQHYALARDVEIAVVDAEHRHGNGHCLPAGPLREPVSRLARVDAVVHAGGGPEPSYSLRVEFAENAATGERRPLSAFAGQRVHAVAGIGQPERFFASLRGVGIDVAPVPVPDHGRLSMAALTPADGLPVLMTAKDQVKYTALTARHWVVEVEVTMTTTSRDAILAAVDMAMERFRAREKVAHD